MVQTRSGKRTSPRIVSSRKRKLVLKNLPPEILRRIGEYTGRNIGKLASVSRYTRNTLKNNVKRVKNNQNARNKNIHGYELEIARLVPRPGTNNINPEFIRLANEYYKKYPNTNQNERLYRKFSLFYGSGYYKRWANRLRPSQPITKTNLRNLHWVKMAPTGPRYVHWIAHAPNGKMYRYFPFRTRKGTLIVNGKEYPKAKNLYIFPPQFYSRRSQ